MSRYCLDTSAYSYFKKGEPQVLELIDAADWIGVSSIFLGELRTGFLLGQHLTRNEEELVEFLTHPVVEVLVVDEETSKVFAEIVCALRRSGTPLPTNDVWIAASAARDGATVLTFDRHFTAISRIGSIVLSPSFGP